MYYVYIIKSEETDWFYVGMTSNLNERLRRHNQGRERATKAYKPFKLIYSKLLETRLDARDYEKYLKVRSNKEKLLKELKYL